MELSIKTGQSLKYRIKGFFACNRRKIAVVSVISVMLLTGLILFSTLCAPAKDPDDGYGALMGFVRTEVNYISTACSGDKIQAAIAKDFSYKDEGTITGLLMTYSASICVMLWFGSLVSAYVNQQAYAELIVKKIIILGISGVLITNAPTIVQTIMDIGSEIAKRASALNNTTSENATGEIMAEIHRIADNEYDAANGVITKKNEEIEKEFDKEDPDNTWVKVESENRSWWSKITGPIMGTIQKKFVVPISFAFVLLLPMICTAVAYVIIMIACYSRGVEMAILRTLSPIPMGLVANEPLGSGAGARFLKNVAAVSLQGLVLVAIPVVCSGLVKAEMQTFINLVHNNGGTLNGLFGTLLSQGLSMSAVSIAMAVLMTRSLSIAQKALGLQ